jgi:hypothetical protein
LEEVCPPNSVPCGVLPIVAVLYSGILGIPPGGFASTSAHKQLPYIVELFIGSKG